MRGSNVIGKLFNDDDANKHRKGRSKDLHNKRNLALAYRYYYYSKFTKMRYEAIIEMLSNEFYITPVTLAEALQDNADTLSKVKKESPSIAYLKTNYKHYNWSLNDVEFLKKN